MFKSKVKRESDQFLINKKLMEKLITKRNMLIERAIEKSKMSPTTKKKLVRPHTHIRQTAEYHMETMRSFGRVSVPKLTWYVEHNPTSSIGSNKPETCLSLFFFLLEQN